MKIFLFLILLVSNGYSPNTTFEQPIDINNLGGNISNRNFAKVYYNSSPWNNQIKESLLHEFDCSIPRWRKDKPIINCSMSKDIELILYEYENYQGEYKVLSSTYTTLAWFDQKFRTPGSIEVFFKGNRGCISKANQEFKNKNTKSKRNKSPRVKPQISGTKNSKIVKKNTERKAIDYITRGEKQRKLSWSSCSSDVYVENIHESRNIEIKYKICGGKYDDCSIVKHETIQYGKAMVYGSRGCSDIKYKYVTIEIIDARFKSW